MNYIQIDFKFQDTNSSEAGEILIAHLSELPFDSFEETENGIRAFMPHNAFDKNETETFLEELKPALGFDYEIVEIEDQNWNEQWESNYQPVLIDGKCYIRAPFHAPKPGVDYEIIIEPKMSFGTAHHETTAMMISYVLENEWHERSVLDMGCGTGVLAILASMKGAKKLVAIDNDEWAYTNTLENLERNNTQNILALMGGKEVIPASTFDVILANINRNILLDQMEHYSDSLKAGGKLFMSGFYEADVPVIEKEANRFHIKSKSKKMKNRWAALMMQKN